MPARSTFATRLGFATKSRAPSSRARNTLPLAEFPEITKTGVGLRAMSKRRNVNPSMRGISRSSVTRSGSSWSASRNASSPSFAFPTTTTSGMLSSKPVMVRRLNAESSTTSTRSGFIGALSASGRAHYGAAGTRGHPRDGPARTRSRCGAATRCAQASGSPRAPSGRRACG